MSAQTSTKRVSTQNGPAVGTDAGMQPWHLFLIMTLLATATAAVAVRGTSPANVIFICLTVASAGFAAWAVYRTIAPLAEPDSVEEPEMLGGETRAALEREKALLLRAIQELEFDRAMGKVSESDWQAMTGRLRNRAIRVVGQLDGGGEAYRDLIDRELQARKAAGSGPAAGGGRSSPPGRSAARALVIAVLAGGSLAMPARAQMGGAGATAGMPDARAMSGIPRQDPQLPAGTVSARLVRGQVTNLVVGFPVEFIVDGKSQSVATDVTGHAVLCGVPPGATIRVVATMGSERVDSQPFQMPPQGGMVLMLVAGDQAGAAATASAAVEGSVTLGGQSRIVTAFEDEELQVYYLFDIVNAGQAPVRTREPLVFELPSGAGNVTLLEGSTPTAVVKGTNVVVPGPFPPGATSLQIAFSMAPAGSVSIRQKLPVAMDQVTVMVEKVGAVVVASPQLTMIREGNSNAKQFVLGTGPGLPAGGVLSLAIAGLPHPATWPRDTALAVGFLTLVAGAWGASRTHGRSAEAVARQQLEARREQAFGKLLALDARRQSGEIGRADADERREHLMGELERIYGELDTGASGASASEGHGA
jgi:hypothetical protein